MDGNKHLKKHKLKKGNMYFRLIYFVVSVATFIIHSYFELQLEKLDKDLTVAENLIFP